MNKLIKTTALLTTAALVGAGAAAAGMLWLKPFANKWPTTISSTLLTSCAWKAFEDGDLEAANVLAEQGDADHAQNQYLRGAYSESRNAFSDAVELFEKSASQGFPHAMWKMACCYRDGRGVPNNGKLSVFWAEKAAEGGIVEACLMAARAYTDGNLVPRSLSKAHKLWLRAANKGHAEAQYRIAHAYECGEGVNRNIDEAAIWYDRARINGYAGAADGLARMQQAKRQESWTRIKEHLRMLFV